MKHKAAIGVLMVALMMTLAVCAQAAVEMYEVKASTLVPAFIDYKLNCAADVTIQILPSDASGTPTGAAIRTVTLTGQSRGFHRYIWLADKDDGTTATRNAYYVAQLSATSNQARWDPIIGLYINSDYNHEYPARDDLPAVPDTEGFYGVAVNSNPSSPYYGRIYATHKIQKAVFMYGPDGEYLGKFPFAASNWGTSAPWDIAIADDDYVYVCDRSTMFIQCFDPQGNHMSTSPVTTNHRAIFARKTSDGKTHLLFTGSGNNVKQLTVNADHTTWQTSPFGGNTLFDTGSDAANNFGMWTNSTVTTVYQACLGGGGDGVSKWNLTAGVWTKETQPAQPFVQRISSAADVSLVDDATDYLWITRQVGRVEDDPDTTQNERVRAIYKTNASTNATIASTPFDIVTWGLMNSPDGVGNVALTFGKATATWAQRYWGLFAEPGITTCSTKKTGAFFLGATPAPVVVPGSAVWTPDNTIAANDSDTASVSFKVMDVDGWADITSVTLDLIPLGYSGATVCTRAQDLSDPNGKTAIATLNLIKAKVGTRCTTSYGQPVHNLKATAADAAGGSNFDDSAVNINVTGDPTLFPASIKHRRVTGWFIEGAQIQAVGGGIAGATDLRAKGPFTYNSAPSNTSGAASLELSAGTFQVTAKKLGFGSETPINVSVPYSSGTQIIYLRPLTIAEARATGNATKINVEGVCYAQPQGLAPTAAIGLAPRTDTLVKRGQFYVCDPNSPANGMLFMVTENNTGFALTWHDPDAMDDFGNPLYIGQRPAVGQTIMVTGLLDTPGGHERRVLVQDADLIAGLAAFNVNRTYYNRGSAPGGLPANPDTVAISVFAHPITDGFSNAWGRYIKTTGATVIGYQADGVESGVALTDPVPYLTIADVNGRSAHVAIDMPTTLGVTTIPGLKETYTFTGAASRRTRYGQGSIHVRSQGDMVFQTAAPAAPVDMTTVIRTANVGDPANISGIVVAKIGNAMWLEAADRSMGIRVKVNPTYVALGDMVQVVGTFVLENGAEMAIQPTIAVLPISAGNTQPGALDMRSREIGGVGNGTTPGVDTGRGALNVGLKVHFLGMVTAIDPSATPAWYYLWDGANRSDLPVSDASGNLGVKIAAAPPAACVAWKDWVDVTGQVGAESLSGSTIPTIVPSAATKVTTFATISSPAGTALTAQWNLMSVPSAPAEISDGDEWTAKAWEPYHVLAPTKDPMEIDGRFYRWENCSGGLNIYDMWSEVGAHGPFGGLMLGDGYWLNIDADWAVSYKGKNSTLDQWIGICEPGWMIIGHPKDHNTFLADVKVHDGGAVYSMYDAVMTNAWIDCVGYWWDNAGQGLVDIGIPDCWATSDTLMPWHGYWLQAYQGNLALIVPEAPAAP